MNVQGTVLRTCLLAFGASALASAAPPFDWKVVVNNLDSLFVEPPSIPRIDMYANTIASRGVHPPTWRYMLPDGTDTRVGTTGIYTNPFGALVAGASNVGNVPDFGFLGVPGHAGVKFDMFPGAVFAIFIFSLLLISLDN